MLANLFSSISKVGFGDALKEFGVRGDDDIGAGLFGLEIGGFAVDIEVVRGTFVEAFGGEATTGEALPGCGRF